MLPTKKSISQFYDVLSSEECEFKAVETLLKKDESLAFQIENPFEKNTALHIAVMNPFCKVEVIRLLINSGVNLLAKNHASRTALHLALDQRKYNLGVIKELLKTGISLSDTDRYGLTPLMIALSSINYDTSVIKALITAGCDVNTGPDDVPLHGPFDVPLHIYCKPSPLCCLLSNTACSLEVVRLLLDEGAKLRRSSEILTYICNSNCKTEIIQELLCRGEDFMVKDIKHRRNSLHLSVLKPNCFKIVSFLLTNVNLDINEGDIENETPLNLLLRHFDVDERVVHLFLKHGADVNIPNIKNRRPLHQAVNYLNSKIRIVNMLLDAGASISDLGENEKSPLIIVNSNENRNIECAKLLIKYGVKENFKNHERLENFIECKTDWTSLCPDFEHTTYEDDLPVYADNCLLELIQTKMFMLRENFTLFDVIKDSKLIQDEHTIQKIFKIFSSHDFPIYKHCVAESIGRSYLLRKSRDLQISCRSCHDSNYLVTFSNFIDNLAFYLSNDDLFNLYLTSCIYS